jgi:hypothetical protein
MVADRGHTADYVSVGQLSAKGASWHDSASWRKRSFGWHSDVGLIDQGIVPRPKLQSLTLLPQNHDRDTVRSDGDMEIDPEASDSHRVDQKRMLRQIAAIPATLYFPTSIVAELNEICKSLGFLKKY